MSVHVVPRQAVLKLAGVIREGYDRKVLQKVRE